MAVTVELQFEGIPDPTRLPSKKELQDLSTHLFRKEGHIHAVRISKKFRDVLRLGSPEGIGASGKAANNIYERWEQTFSGTWVIYEGPARANRIIRTGIKPGRKVSYNVLRKWAMNKGIKLYYNTKDHVTTLNKMKPRSGFKYDSVWFKDAAKPSKSKTVPDSGVTRNALHALRYALFKEGTERVSANWYPKQPSGSGRFDYPAYVLKKDHVFITGELKTLAGKLAQEYSSLLNYSYK